MSDTLHTKFYASVIDALDGEREGSVSRSAIFAGGVRTSWPALDNFTAGKCSPSEPERDWNNQQFWAVDIQCTESRKIYVSETAAEQPSHLVEAVPIQRCTAEWGPRSGTKRCIRA